jgi:two-component system, response regulator PdtaR
VSALDMVPRRIAPRRLAWVVRNRWPPVALILTSGQTDLPPTDLPSGGRFLRKPYLPSQVEAALRQVI